LVAGGYMWNIFNRNKKEHDLNIKVLFKNDISILILDERWNGLFKNIVKTNDIIDCENNIKELLKEQARIIAESKDIAVIKKECMDNIIKLTTEAFDNNSQQARSEMQECEKKIIAINNRIKEIEERLLDIPKEIREANLELLEQTVKVVYFSIRENQQKVAELDTQIGEVKEHLKKLVEQRALIAEDDTDTYSYFHDLLGKDELQKLDEIYFNNK
jgi:chromosome segregation ATPase